MERYLVEFKAKDNEEDYCFILAESPLDAKKWVEDYIHVSVIRVSLIDIHDESNKEKDSRCWRMTGPRGFWSAAC